MNTISQTPIPDPTLLTTEALQREIAGLKELLQSKIDSLDEAMRLRFETVDVRFDDADAALKTALTAQEKTNDKSDTATSKRFDEQRALLEINERGSNDKINELRDRLTRAETSVLTQRDTKVDRQTSGSYVALIVFGATAFLVSIAGILVAILKH